MAMHTETLTVGMWYQIEDLDDPSFVYLYVDSTDTVILAFDAASPSSSSTVGGILTEGWNGIPIPIGKSAWVKLLSGTADVVYSKYDGITIDITKCAYAVTDTVAVDEVQSNTVPVAGFDATPTDDLTYVGLIHTVAAGIAAAATIDAASLILTFSRSLAGRQFVVHGIESATSVTAGLTDYASLASGLTLTTASETFTVDYTGRVVIDFAAILQELVGVSGWATTSPIQIWIAADDTMPGTAIDATIAIQPDSRNSAVFATVS
jgi:hypothetical protein